jgi:hypothetical protein
MNKGSLGLVLVILGVSVAAVFGARNTAGVNKALILEGNVSIPVAATKAKYDEYCKLLKAEVEAAPYLKKIGIADGCLPDPEETEDSATSSTTSASETDALPKTYEDVFAGMVQDHQKQLRESTSLKDSPVKDAREAWLNAKTATIAPIARKQTTPKISIGPTERVSDWFSLAGLPFLLGLGLIVGGGMLARQAHREKALSSGSVTNNEKGPVDFGELISKLHHDVSSLHAAACNEAPQAEALLTTIETIQFETLEPLIDSRGKVQARFGMAGFADIFSPLSGGERNLNRAWSALVDQHLPEAQVAIETAKQQIAEAETALKRQISTDN